MAILAQDIRDKLAGFFGDMPGDVDLRLFSGPQEDAAEVMRQLLAEMAEVSARLRVQTLAAAPVIEPGRNADAQAEGPVLEVAPGGSNEARVRFLGVAAGHEFGSLVGAIRNASLGTTDLSAGAVERLKAVRHPVHIQVFTTPT